MSEPINKNTISNILAEFMDDVNEWESQIGGTPNKEDLAELDAIYEDAITKLDKEYLK